MKLTLVLCFAVVLCDVITPVLGQGINPAKILAIFKKPYTCGQCPAAYKEFLSQVCYEVTRPLAVFDPFNIREVCQATLNLAFVLGNGHKFCEPFGTCPFGGNPKAYPITCE